MRDELDGAITFYPTAQALRETTEAVGVCLDLDVAVGRAQQLAVQERGSGRGVQDRTFGGQRGRGGDGSAGDTVDGSERVAVSDQSGRGDPVTGWTWRQDMVGHPFRCGRWRGRGSGAGISRNLPDGEGKGWGPGIPSERGVVLTRRQF